MITMLAIIIIWIIVGLVFVAYARPATIADDAMLVCLWPLHVILHFWRRS